MFSVSTPDQICLPISVNNEIVLFRLVTKANANSMKMKKPAKMRIAAIGERIGLEPEGDDAGLLGVGLELGV